MPLISVCARWFASFAAAYGLDEEDFDLGDPAGGGDPGEGEKFAEPESRQALEELEDSIAEMDGEMQAQAEAALAAIFEVAENSSSFEEFSERLPDAYPDILTDSLAAGVEKAAFLAAVWGGMNADE